MMASLQSFLLAFGLSVYYIDVSSVHIQQGVDAAHYLARLNEITHMNIFVFWVLYYHFAVLLLVEWNTRAVLQVHTWFLFSISV
ncbi:MAG: hypothetical protein CL912_32970 [Deltaproteobacteria bacterium]|nr:hypothetical protein [Deltaproteobacteria bacterium]|tara:strand:- start:394 stop:645 length:252 start_codon:yes stop_codon:yes gene_type:complete